MAPHRHRHTNGPSAIRQMTGFPGKSAADGAAYRGAALIPTDCDAFWYQAALLSDTARLALACFLRADFLD